jgi:hypothetical protein
MLRGGIIGGEFADEYTETIFYYDVATIDESATIIGTSLKLIDFHIIEDYVGGVGIVEGAYGIGSDGLYHFLFGSHMGVPNTRNDDPLLDSRYFDPQSRIRIETELRIHAHEQFAGGSIDSFEQRFSQSVIPVPPALWLFGAGLLGLVGIARRRSNTSLPINRKQYLSRSHSPLRGLFHRNSDMH